MQKQGGGGGEKDRARSKRRGRAGQIVGFMDRWRGDRGRRGEERTVLGSTPLCYRRNLSRSFREGGQASEGRGTGHGCEPCASPCPFLVPLFPYDLQRSSPLPHFSKCTVKKIWQRDKPEQGWGASGSGRKMARALLLLLLSFLIFFWMIIFVIMHFEVGFFRLAVDNE